MPSQFGPDDKRIALASLPPRGLKHLLPHHKVLVVEAVRHGLVTVDDVCRLYHLSIDEYVTWHCSVVAERSSATCQTQDDGS